MTEHEERGEQLEEEANYLEEEGAQVDDRIDAAKKDWDSKVDDSSVPGAQPSDDEDDGGA